MNRFSDLLFMQKLLYHRVFIHNYEKFSERERGRERDWDLVVVVVVLGVFHNFLYLNLVILEKRMIQSRLFSFMNAVYDISIWALRNQWKTQKPKQEKKTSSPENNWRNPRWNLTHAEKWKTKYIYTSMVLTAGLLILSRCFWILLSLKLLTCLCLE